jgi:nucleotide-binding universal stress UspA family protein
MQSGHGSWPFESLGRAKLAIPLSKEEVLEEIKNQKVDLLIMATKGRSDLVGTIIGSCAQKLFRRSPIQF